MMKSTKPWVPKLRPEQEPKVCDDTKGKGKMLVPTPMLVAAVIHKVPRGKLITPKQIRETLAKQFKADWTCPLTTGIFINIIAGAAEEQMAAGEPPVAPYWRIIMDDGGFSKKMPPGEERQAELLRKEGFTIGVKGRTGKLVVERFEEYL